jgi:hypothetical protein
VHSTVVERIDKMLMQVITKIWGKVKHIWRLQSWWMIDAMCFFFADYGIFSFCKLSKTT